MIRQLRLEDLPAALALQADNYPPSLHDGQDAFASRIRVAPQWCWAIENQGRLEAYVLSHPWAEGSPPAPDTVLARAEGPVWYVHDLSVSPAARGSGLGRRLVEHIVALHAPTLSELIAVEGAGPFWSRLGWTSDDPLDPALASKVNRYGPRARFMRRRWP